MRELCGRLAPLLGRVWWCGPLEGGVTAVGLTNCVALTLGLLAYLSTVSLDQVVTVILVIFACILALLANLLLLYGSATGQPQLLVPWLVVSLPATLALLLYTSIMFTQLAPYQAVYLGVLLLSTYFCAVVVTQIHELRAQQAAVKKPKLEDLEEGKEQVEEATVLMELESSPPSLPQPEEVISVEKIKQLQPSNPFLEDVFKVKALQRAAKQTTSSGSMDIRADFTPFKKEEEREEGVEGELPAKLRIFLPQTGDGEESDFDFSFNDPVFDSSLCVQSHQAI